MRGALYANAATLSAFAPPLHAQAIQGELSLHSSYVDTKSFNERFSADPVAQLTLELDLGNGFHVEPYVYTGFARPFGDSSSEYGVEMSWEREISPAFTTNVAVGRWANYQGEGIRAGDWFARIGGSRGDLTVSASVLVGVSDTVLLNAEYKLRPASSLAIVPKIAYITADRALNPGADLSYQFARNLGVVVRIVVPEDLAGRHLYGSVGLVWSFSHD